MAEKTTSSHDAESVNRAFWDEVALVHLEAYKEVGMLREKREILDEIGLREVGDVTGKSMLHLQCPIGTDILDDRWFTLPDHTGKLPLLLTLRARKPS